MEELEPTRLARPEWRLRPERLKAGVGFLGEGQLASSHRLGSLGSTAYTNGFLIFQVRRMASPVR